MPLSTVEQQEFQDLVSSATPEQRRLFKVDAEAKLAQINMMMGRMLAPDVFKVGEVAIEILVRIESAENGKGWLFRTKRRLQLVQMYLGT